MKTHNINVNGTIFRISADKQLSPLAVALVESFGKIPSEELKDGYKIQMGFNLFILLERSFGYRVVVPEYTFDPFSEATTDLSTALWVQIIQANFMRKYNIQGEGVRFDDKIMAAKDSLQSKTIAMQRFRDLGEGYSGWSVKAMEKDENGIYDNILATEYESHYAFELLAIRPSVIQALVLPYDYVVIFENDEILEILVPC